MPEGKISDLMSEYTLPPQMKERIKQAFSRFPGEGVAYLLDGNQMPWKFSYDAGEKGARAYRALGNYTAKIISDLFSSEEGRALYKRLLAVMTQQSHGVLIKGLPEDLISKSLFIFGLKTLAAHDATFEVIWGDGPLPDVISRGPEDKYAFHHDSPSALLRNDDPSFMCLGLGQPYKSSVPTLFKKTNDRNENHIAIHLGPDELVFFNNRTLEHSAGLKSRESLGERHLLRYVIDSTTLSHPTSYSFPVNELMQDVPSMGNPEILKEWLIKELEKMKTFNQLKF